MKARCVGLFLCSLFSVAGATKSPCTCLRTWIDHLRKRLASPVKKQRGRLVVEVRSYICRCGTKVTKAKLRFSNYELCHHHGLPKIQDILSFPAALNHCLVLNRLSKAPRYGGQAARQAEPLPSKSGTGASASMSFKTCAWAFVAWLR